MTAVVFKARQPQAIADYLAAHEAKQEAFQNATKDFREKVGGRELFGIRFFDGGFVVNGFHMNSYNEELPAGWRRDGNKLMAVPAKRTPEGKEIVAELAKLRLDGNSYPGCPRDLHTETVNGRGFAIFPRIEKVGDEYYLTLSEEPRASELDEIDPEQWERVKLSAYHAAVEDAEAGATV